jgi:hypothetical protein
MFRNGQRHRLYLFTRHKPVTGSGTNVAPLLKSGNGGFLKLFYSYENVSAALQIPNKAQLLHLFYSGLAGLAKD